MINMIKSTANGLSVEVIDLIQRRITFIYIYILYIYFVVISLLDDL